MFTLRQFPTGLYPWTTQYPRPLSWSLTHARTRPGRALHAHDADNRAQRGPAQQLATISTELQRLTALTLSRYCVYLVAYEPGLLPDDEAWAKKVYKDTVTELNSLFRSCSTAVHRREALINFSPAGEEEEKSVVAKGVKLGKQLMCREQPEDADDRMRGHEKVWGMLLEFWAELLVFAASRPTAGPEAHARALANGGEFITHIWTMLTHAGIQVPKRRREEQACYGV